MRPVRLKYGLTQMEFSVLMFLDRNPDENTAADIVKRGRFAKSHVSLAVRELERKELLSGCCLKGNNKVIRLILTEKAKEILYDTGCACEQYMGVLFDGFSDEEMLRFKMYFERLCQNAEKELNTKH